MKESIKISLFLLTICLSQASVFNSYSQCDPLVLNLPAQACINEAITIDNSGLTGYDSFVYDFCPGDLRTTPTGMRTSILGASGPQGLEIIKDNGLYYGIMASTSNNTLIRMVFGNGIGAVPTLVESLGNVSGQLNGPSEIDLIEEAGIWKGLVLNRNTNSLVLITFPNGIDQNPVASPITTPAGNSLSSPGSVEIIDNNGTLLAFIVNNTPLLNRLNFGNSLDNDPTGDDISLISGISPQGVEVINDCGDWYIFTTSLSFDNVYRLDFGGSIDTASPTPQEILTTGDMIVNPRGIKVALDSAQYRGVITSSDGTLYTLDLGNSISNNSGEVLNLGDPSSFNVTFGLNIVKEESQFHLLACSSFDRRLYQAVYERDCGLAFTAENSNELGTISFPISGLFSVELIGEIGNTQNSVVDQIEITSDVAPTISLSSNNICVTSSIQFNSSSDQTINTYQWSFGDSNTSTDPSPIHVYALPGEYTVTLNVVSADGCSNSIDETITIFDEPSPSFNLPSGPFCTNQAVFVENTTPGDFQGNISYQWELNGQLIASTEDLDNLIFTSSGAQQLKLIASIPGCEVEFIQNITNVSEGPTPQFNVNDDCVGTLMQFNNTSSGQISSQTWDFGNGFTSTLENPAFEYSDPGTYEVTLAVVNNEGCVVSRTESVTVYSLPEVQFANELACEENLTQFIDGSQVANANIINWQWDFGDMDSDNNSSIARDPIHIFSTSGDFEVKLITTSTFGCQDSVTQTVSVLPAAEVDFSFDRICVGEPVQFQDLSQAPANSSLTSWAWDLGGVFSDQQNPEFTFDIPAEYNVSLTVTSDNRCTSTIEKIIRVAPVPNVSFGVELACDNTPAHFFDLTQIVDDEVVEWLWDFDGLGQSTDSATSFLFTEAGQYNISLTVLTGNGCDYNTIRTVQVNESPRAQFTSDFSLGSPPLTVQFFNLSEPEGNTYAWDFGDGGISNEDNPTYIFEELGEYDVRLIANNPEGCSDTTNQKIFVLFPELDIVLQNMAIIPNGLSNNIILTITNNGTIFIDSLEAIIDLGDQAVLNEKIVRNIPPGETINHTLNLSIGQNRLEYVCVTIEPSINGIIDENIANNNRCDRLTSDLLLLPPFPNPARDMLTVSIVSAEERSINLQLVSTQGGVVRQFNILVAQGFNNLELDVSDIKNGLYILNILSGELDLSTRVMISN